MPFPRLVRGLMVTCAFLSLGSCGGDSAIEPTALDPTQSAPIDPPTLTAAGSSATDSATVSWIAAGAGYNYEVHVSGDPDFVPSASTLRKRVASVARGEGETSFGGLSAGTTYFLKIVAKDDRGGQSAPSSPLAVTTSSRAVELNPGVSIVSESALGWRTTAMAENGLTLGALSASPTTPTVGSYLVGQVPGDGGTYLRKVVSISTSGSDLVVETRDAAVPELFRNASISVAAPGVAGIASAAQPDRQSLGARLQPSVAAASNSGDPCGVSFTLKATRNFDNYYTTAQLEIVDGVPSMTARIFGYWYVDFVGAYSQAQNVSVCRLPLAIGDKPATAFVLIPVYGVPVPVTFGFLPWVTAVASLSSSKPLEYIESSGRASVTWKGAGFTMPLSSNPATSVLLAKRLGAAEVEVTRSIPGGKGALTEAVKADGKIGVEFGVDVGAVVGVSKGGRSAGIVIPQEVRVGVGAKHQLRFETVNAEPFVRPALPVRLVDASYDATAEVLGGVFIRSLSQLEPSPQNTKYLTVWSSNIARLGSPLVLVNTPLETDIDGNVTGELSVLENSDENRSDPKSVRYLFSPYDPTTSLTRRDARNALVPAYATRGEVCVVATAEHPVFAFLAPVMSDVVRPSGEEPATLRFDAATLKDYKVWLPRVGKEYSPTTDSSAAQQGLPLRWAYPTSPHESDRTLALAEISRRDGKAFDILSMEESIVANRLFLRGWPRSLTVGYANGGVADFTETTVPWVIPPSERSDRDVFWPAIWQGTTAQGEVPFPWATAGTVRYAAMNLKNVRSLNFEWGKFATDFAITADSVLAIGPPASLVQRIDKMRVRVSCDQNATPYVVRAP